MRSEKNGGNESAPTGITPCVRGDSLLEILTGAGKFAGRFGSRPAVFYAGFSFHVFAISF